MSKLTLTHNAPTANQNDLQQPMPKRESNIELLRIVCMFMILGLHYFNKWMGGAFGNIPEGHYNLYIADILESAFIMGVNCFVLITGYFSITAKTANLRKIFDLLLMAAFYDILFYFIAISCGLISYDPEKALYSQIIILGGNRWFVKSFAMLMLLCPIINLIVRRMSKARYGIMLAVIFCVFNLIYSFCDKSLIKDDGYGVVNFVILYLIGGYIRVYFSKKINSWIYVAIYVGCAALTLWSTKLPLTELKAWNYAFFSNMIGAVALFMAFREMKIPYNGFINKASRYMFGVYLIHTDFNITSFIYQKVFHCGYFWTSPYFTIHMIASCLALMAMCLCFDIGREWIFGKTLSPLLNKIKFKSSVYEWN